MKSTYPLPTFVINTLIRGGHPPSVSWRWRGVFPLFLAVSDTASFLYSSLIVVGKVKFKFLLFMFYSIALLIIFLDEINTPPPPPPLRELSTNRRGVKILLIIQINIFILSYSCIYCKCCKTQFFYTYGSVGRRIDSLKFIYLMCPPALHLVFWGMCPLKTCLNKKYLQCVLHTPPPFYPVAWLHLDWKNSFEPILYFLNRFSKLNWFYLFIC